MDIEKVPAVLQDKINQERVSNERDYASLKELVRPWQQITALVYSGEGQYGNFPLETTEFSDGMPYVFELNVFHNSNDQSKDLYLQLPYDEIDIDGITPDTVRTKPAISIHLGTIRNPFSGEDGLVLERPILPDAKTFGLDGNYRTIGEQVSVATREQEAVAFIASVIDEAYRVNQSKQESGQ